MTLVGIDAGSDDLRGPSTRELCQRHQEEKSLAEETNRTRWWVVGRLDRMMISFQVDGATVKCAPGMTVAGALVQIGHPILRVTEIRQEPRSMFCGMGVCFECAMIIDGRSSVRACMTPVTEGLKVTMQRGAARISVSP